MEAVIPDLGGFGRFQALTVTAIYSTNIFVVWSMFLMAYGNYNPGWTCSTNSSLNFSTSSLHPGAENVSRDHNVSEGQRRAGTCEDLNSCEDMRFLDDSSTIVTEWTLLCDQDWISNLIISLQMFGGFIGAYCGGQMGDRFGRKKVLYCNLGLGAIANALAAFSNSWQMFAVIRFFIGFFSVAMVSIITTYSMEFLDSKGRSYISAIPCWSTSSIVFSVCAWLLKDWRYLEVVTAGLGALLFLPVFYVPESLHWLAATGKIQEAENLVRTICRINRIAVPELGFITEIAEEERGRKQAMTTYTHLALLQRKLRKMSIIFFIICVFFSMVYYAISFGVKSLFGDFYLNLILMPVLSIPAMFITPPVAIKLGRKRGSLFLLAIAIVCAASLIMTYFLGSVGVRGTVITVLAFLCNMFTSMAWTLCDLFIVESFPTVVRTLAYSGSVMAARVGSIIAPYVIAKNFHTLYISFSVVVALLSVCFVAMLPLKETRDDPLKDTMALRGQVERVGHRQGRQEGEGEEEVALKASLEDKTDEEDEVRTLSYSTKYGT